MGLDDLSTKVEPDTRATDTLRGAVEMVLDAEKLLEDALPERFGHARSGVRHGKLQVERAALFSILPRDDLDENARPGAST
jgi:hypothetical protein